MNDKFVLRTYKVNSAEIKSGVIRIDGTAAEALKEAQAATGLHISVIASKAIKWALERLEVEEV